MTRQAKITDEHRAEAERLRALWDAVPARPTQAEFGELYGIGNQSAVGQFLRAITPLSLKAARGFAAGLRCGVGDFSPRLESEIKVLAAGVSDPAAEFALIRRADVSVSAGRGALVFDEGGKSALSFRRDFLRGMGINEKRCVVVSVSGHSMEPTINDGAVLLVNQADTDVSAGHIYAFRLDGLLYVKRLTRALDGSLQAKSDNPDQEQFPEMRFDHRATGFEMIGKVVWMGKRL